MKYQQNTIVEDIAFKMKIEPKGIYQILHSKKGIEDEGVEIPDAGSPFEISAITKSFAGVASEHLESRMCDLHQLEQHK